jgi:hypothetical protein
MLQQRGLAIRIAHRTITFRLHLGNLPRQPGALAERRDEHGIDVVEAFP